MSSKAVGIISLLLGVLGIIASVASPEFRTFLGLENKNNVELPSPPSDPMVDKPYEGHTSNSDANANSSNNQEEEKNCLQNILGRANDNIFVHVNIDGEYSGTHTTTLIHYLNSLGIESTSPAESITNIKNKQCLLNVEIQSSFNSTSNISSNPIVKKSELITGRIEGSYIFKQSSKSFECPINGVLAGKNKNQIITQLIEDEFKL